MSEDKIAASVVAGVVVLPADEGTVPWLGKPVDVPVYWDGDVDAGEIGRAHVRAEDGALVADITLDGGVTLSGITDFGAYGTVTRDSFLRGVRTIEEVTCVGLGARKA